MFLRYLENITFLHEQLTAGKSVLYDFVYSIHNEHVLSTLIRAPYSNCITVRQFDTP